MVKPGRIPSDPLRPRSAPNTHAEWLRLLNRCEVCAQYAPLLGCMGLGEVENTRGTLLTERVRQEGIELAKLGVPPQCVAVAVERYLAVRIAENKTQDGKWLKGLLKWCADYQYAVFTGYSEHVEAERRAQEQATEDVEARLRGLSTELREVYEKERRRLAQDLHDEVGHDLIVLKLYIEMIVRDLGGGDLSRVRRKLNESVTLIQHALKGVRHLAFSLGTSRWEEGGFLSAIRLYVRQFAARTELKARFTARKLRAALSSDYEDALYKALQGALANVAAHAGAKEVSIDLSNDDQDVVMRVTDDGIGFNVARKLNAPQFSFGLRAMRERIESLGGTIAFRSRATKIGTGTSGTVIEFRLPLQPISS